MMAAIKGKDTKPERIVRSYLHRAGFRFSLHRKDLPGRPDIVLPKYRTVVFVHGCFWHQHRGCANAATPASHRPFWQKKLTGNQARDSRNNHLLHELGWTVVTLWECELGEPSLKSLANQLTR